MEALRLLMSGWLKTCAGEWLSLELYCETGQSVPILERSITLRKHV